ncbi:MULTISPECIES: hypothetical protein [unclassified Haematobacter]|uniref:hypothetical protein n=1 Tax=unclassified Haematobacter TaxID=2640585 RepID=UPI0025BA89F2|nr:MULTISPECIES: hypothetical protein [unclassified Haematobacter]
MARSSLELYREAEQARFSRSWERAHDLLTQADERYQTERHAPWFQVAIRDFRTRIEQQMAFDEALAQFDRATDIRDDDDPDAAIREGSRHLGALIENAGCGMADNNTVIVIARLEQMDALRAR